MEPEAQARLLLTKLTGLAPHTVRVFDRGEYFEAAWLDAEGRLCWTPRDDPGSPTTKAFSLTKLRGGGYPFFAPGVFRRLLASQPDDDDL